jgi:acyl-CoA synthetase (NDP forming)
MVVGARLVAPLCGSLLERGCRRFVIVSNGFGETGTEAGRAHEADLRAVFADAAAMVVGPNCVGFASFHESLCAITQPVPHGIRPGDVSVVSQSGGLTGAAMGAVVSEGLGLDVCYSIGNGTVFGLAAAVRSALERESTRIVVGVVESVDEPDEVASAARLAADTGKTIIVLPLGQSDAGRGIAQSHTGAVVGEQRLISVWLQSLGIVLADSAEQLGRIAALVAKVGRPRAGKGTFIATVSGGGAGLSADLAARNGVRLAHVQDSTRGRLRELLPAGAYIGNPLDVQTGDGNAVYTAIAEDPNVELMIEPWMLPWPDDELHWQRDALERIAGIADRAGVPLVVGALFNQPLNEWATGFGDRTGVSVTPNLEMTMAALGKLYAAIGPAAPTPSATDVTDDTSRGSASSGLISEVQARGLLERAGLPVVRGVVAANVDELVEHVGELRKPWVAKLALPEVGHKGRIGGVRLGLSDTEALRAACAGISASATAAGASDGSDIAFLVTETEFGAELLVGALRDPVAGPSLTVAVGGWAAESGLVFGTVPLPATSDQLRQVVRSWNLDHLLGESRADDLAGFLAMLGKQFAIGDLAQFATVEINPLMLTDHGPSIVDALIVDAVTDAS